MKVTGKIIRLGPAVDYSMLRLPIEGADIITKKYYKNRSLEIFNICLIENQILYKFEI
jgi:hypothetical protein